MNPKASSRKKWWVIVGIVAIVALIIALLLNNVAGSTKPIKNAADKFKPPSDWTLISEDVEPPRFFCLNGGSCPELNRQWQTDKPITQDKLIELLKISSWTYTLGNDCNSLNEPTRYAYDTRYLCTVEISTHNYRARLYITQPEQSTEKFEISLGLWPE